MGGDGSSRSLFGKPSSMWQESSRDMTACQAQALLPTLFESPLPQVTARSPAFWKLQVPELKPPCPSLVKRNPAGPQGLPDSLLHLIAPSTEQAFWKFW